MSICSDEKIEAPLENYKKVAPGKKITDIFENSVAASASMRGRNRLAVIQWLISTFKV